MRVETREVDSEPRRTQLDIGEVGRCGALKSLRHAGRKGELYPGVEAHNHTITATVISRPNGKWLPGAALCRASDCVPEFISLHHECFFARDDILNFGTAIYPGAWVLNNNAVEESDV